MQLNSPKDTFDLSKKIGKILSNGDIVFLYGEIGVGKTTFVRGLINNFQMQRGMKETEVLSPTFNIVLDYEIKELRIMHYDLYRLKNNKDINELGIFEEGVNSIVLVEWPELIEKKPKNRIDLFFEYSEDLNKRTLNIKTYGEWLNHDFEKI